MSLIPDIKQDLLVIAIQTQSYLNFTIEDNIKLFPVTQDMVNAETLKETELLEDINCFAIDRFIKGNP